MCRGGGKMVKRSAATAVVKIQTLHLFVLHKRTKVK